MKKTSHKFQRVFTAMLLMEKRVWDPGWKPRLLLGFKTKKLVEKLQESEGFWMPPGGRLKRSDKSLKHCAQREVLEEVGLFVPLRSMTKVATLDVVHVDGKRFALVHVYMATKEMWDKSGLIRNGREMKNTDFYPLSEVFSDSFKMLPRDKEWLHYCVVSNLCVRVRIVIGSSRTDVQQFSCEEFPPPF
jgi:ADP-ribose pyrophosphatase YjhB (NUDIX family)